MGILGNFVGSAAGAGADMLQKQRESDVALQQQQNFAQFNSDLTLKRERTIMDLRKTERLDEEARMNSPEYLDREAATAESRARARLATKEKLIPDAARVTGAEFDAGAGTRQAAQKEKMSFALDEYRQKTAAELQASIDKMNDPKYLAGVRKEANAKDIDHGAGLRKIQMEAAQIALDEKRAEAKMPPAVKEQAAAYRELLKTKSAAIDKATLEGTATPEGLVKLEAQRDEIGKKIEGLYAPYLGDKAPKPAATGKPGEAEVRYDAQGRAYVKGPDGKPMLRDQPAATASARKPTGILGSAPTDPEPPADSPVGKARAAAAQRDTEKAKSEMRAAEQAQAEFNAATTRQTAAKLQASSSFDYLSDAQQKAIYNRVNGR